MSSYLYLPNLQVQGANALAGHLVVNAAPVMAVNLFAHNLGRKLGVFPTGVAIVHHSADLLGENNFRFNPQQRRGAVFIDKNDYPNGSHALAIQPTASFHWQVSLVLEFAEDANPSVHAVQRFLSSARIAGGQIVDFDPPQPLADSTEVKEAIRSAYWLVERADLLAITQDSESFLAALMQLLGTRPPKKTSESDVATEAQITPEIPAAQGSGEEGDEEEDDDDWLSSFTAQHAPDSPPPPLPRSWLTPTLLGYSALSTPSPRNGSREGLPHAYAESLYGLVQYVSSRDWNFNQRGIPFWRMQWRDTETFVVTCPVPHP